MHSFSEFPSQIIESIEMILLGRNDSSLNLFLIRSDPRVVVTKSQNLNNVCLCVRKPRDSCQTDGVVRNTEPIKQRCRRAISSNAIFSAQLEISSMPIPMLLYSHQVQILLIEVPTVEQVHHRTELRVTNLIMDTAVLQLKATRRRRFCPT